MKQIKLTKGFEAIIDNEDFKKVNQYKWTVKIGYSGIKYAFRTDKNNKTIYLHRFILDVPKKVIIDHINRNGLDNRKTNLRLSNYQQNAFNSKIPSNNTSGIKGVYWDKARNKWHSQIMVNQKMIYLGRFNDLKEAVRSREKAEANYA